MEFAVNMEYLLTIICNYLCRVQSRCGAGTVLRAHPSPGICSKENPTPLGTLPPLSSENPSQFLHHWGFLLFPVSLLTLWELFSFLSPFSRQNLFVPSGALVDLQSYQNSRFGSCIAAVPDLNQDSFNDLVVGAPLEDEHQGAIYVFLGFQETILKKYKQVGLPCVWFSSSFMGINIIYPCFKDWWSRTNPHLGFNC